jgi:hypothetical protein
MPNHAYHAQPLYALRAATPETVLRLFRGGRQGVQPVIILNTPRCTPLLRDHVTGYSVNLYQKAIHCRANAATRGKRVSNYLIDAQLESMHLRLDFH